MIGKQHVIYDCDNTMGLPRKEIDDGLTLYYLLGRPDIELLGVTTVFGNGPLPAVYEQTREMVRALQGPGLPVIRGASARHAENGPAADNEAAQYLAAMAAAHPGEIVLLATGPLSNLCAAAELDGGFFANLRHVVCMGGYLQHPLRIGWQTIGELNLSADPEASFAVLHQQGCPVTVMSAQLGLQVPFERQDLSRMHGWRHDVQRITRDWLWAFGLYCGVPRFFLWDLVPAVYISRPDLFDRHEVCLASGIHDLATGTLAFAQGKGTAVNMPTQIESLQEFKAVLFEAWSRLLEPSTI